MFDDSGVPASELPVIGMQVHPYFWSYDYRSGVYFEYWNFNINGGTFGRVNRREDKNANELLYHYSGAATKLIDRITGDLRVIPYFEYADSATAIRAAITKIFLLAPNESDNRTLYFEYWRWNDEIPFLRRIVNPDGCSAQFDPEFPPSLAMQYKLKREVDAEGYETYFSWNNGILTRTQEPNGRIVYYNYDGVANFTEQSELGRLGDTTWYSESSGGGKMPMVSIKRDALGNCTYFGYETAGSLNRLSRRLQPNGNVTYYDYVGGSVRNRWAISKVVSVETGATTYFEYLPGRFDMVKWVGPRSQDGYAVAAYFDYDDRRNRTVEIDALGNVTRFGTDGAGRRVKVQDAIGHVSYFNYGPATGDLNSYADPLGGVSYFGYDSYRNVLKEVSPRWALEGGFSRFTTYYAYDRLDRPTKSIDPLGHVTYFDWTPRSQPLAVVDARRTEIEYAYDSVRSRTQETVTDAAGAVLSQTKHGYDLYKNRIRTQDGNGNTAYFNFDDINRLKSRTDAVSNKTYFYYDTVSNLTELTDPRGSTSYFSYDRLSRLKSGRDALGNRTYFFYDLANNLSVRVNARLNSSYFFYDKLDRVEALRDALANPSYFFYDAVGNASRLRDARGSTTYFFHDGLNRRTKRLDALGFSTYYAYDAASNLTEVTDARSNRTRRVHDALDRPAALIDPTGSAVENVYDEIGNLSVRLRGSLGYGWQPYGTSPYGGTPGPATYFYYDGLSRISAVRDALTNRTYFFYDAVGNRTATKNAFGAATYFGYDAVNRLTRAQDALAKTAYFEYDATGNPVKLIDRNGRAFDTRYDALNCADALRFPDSGSVYFFYDQAGNRAKELNARGNFTYYGYDALDRLLRVQDALARTIYFEYDAVGSRSKSIDAEGASASMTYDAVNRVTNVTYAVAGAAVSEGLRSDPYYVYDAVRNPSKIGDLWGLHQMEYDAVNRMSRHVFPNSKSVYFEYDLRSNVTTRVYPGSAGIASADFDNLDRMTRVQAPSGATTYFAYNALSFGTQRSLGNQAKVDVTYDATDRVATWRGSDKNGAPLAYFDYARDAKGLITKSVREATHTVYYNYDDNDRLVSEIWGASGGEVYAFKYAYDLAGNRTKARINGADTYYSFDTANQLTVKGTNALFASPSYYEYEKNGSLTKLIELSGTTHLAYNAAGLISRIKWRDSSATYFFYDGSLKRYAIRRDATTNYFLWDGLDLLQELNSDGTVKEEHTHAPAGIPGIGQLVESYRPGEAAGDRKIYPIQDLRGTVFKWIKEDGTTVLASREYDVFGRILSSSGTWPGQFGYQGQAWQEIFSLDGTQRILLSPTRLYDPIDGRFIQNEPMLVNRPLKHYVYASNNPLSVLDPSGLDDRAERILRHFGHQYGLEGMKLLRSFCASGGKVELDDLWGTDLFGRRSTMKGNQITLDIDSEGAAVEELWSQLLGWELHTDISASFERAMRMGLEFGSDFNRMRSAEIAGAAIGVLTSGIDVGLFALSFIAPGVGAALGLLWHGGQGNWRMAALGFLPLMPLLSAGRSMGGFGAIGFNRLPSGPVSQAVRANYLNAASSPMFAAKLAVHNALAQLGGHSPVSVAQIRNALSMSTEFRAARSVLDVTINRNSAGTGYILGGFEKSGYMTNTMMHHELLHLGQYLRNPAIRDSGLLALRHEVIPGVVGTPELAAGVVSGTAAGLYGIYRLSQ